MLYLLSLIVILFVPSHIQPINIRHGKDWEEAAGWYAASS
jgi:hypothetical protein